MSPLAKSIVGVKLLLDPSQERPVYLPAADVKSDVEKLPKEPVMVVADFIRSIYQHALQEISEQVPKHYMDLCRKEYVLSGEQARAAIRANVNMHVLC